MTPHEEVVIKVLLPVELSKSRAEVKAFPVGAVELLVERYRVVVGPDPLVAREKLQRFDASADLSCQLNHVGFFAQKAEDCIDGVGGNPVEYEAHYISQHLEKRRHRTGFSNENPRSDITCTREIPPISLHKL